MRSMLTLDPSLMHCCPILIELVINLLHIPSCRFLLRHHLSLALITSHSGGSQVLTLFLRAENFEDLAILPARTP